MELREWIEIAFLGLFSLVAGWFKGEHGRIKRQINDLEKDQSTTNTELAVIKANQTSNKEHLDIRLDSLDRKMDKIFERFEKYDKDRANFFQEFELKRRE